MNDLYGELAEEIEELDEKSSKSAKRKRKKKRAKKKAKRDACYHKVKARYDVWPSAYASGALVKCRKVGAKNWGNSKKEQLQAVIEDEVTKFLQEKEEKDYIPGGLTDKLTGSMEDKHKQLAKMHNVGLEDIEKEVSKGVKVEMEHTNDENIAHEIAMDHVFEDPKYYSKLSAQNLEENSLEDIIYYTLFEVLEEKKRKLTSKPSSETSLRDWFGRKGAPGKKKGWVDCNTCRKDKKTGRKKCSACGRSSGERRSKYPSCRPTPSACGKRGNWGKKSKKGKKG